MPDHSRVQNFKSRFHSESPVDRDCCSTHNDEVNKKVGFFRRFYGGDASVGCDSKQQEQFVIFGMYKRKIFDEKLLTCNLANN